MIRQRVISAAFVAVILIVAVLYVPAVWSVAALSVVLLAAAWEWSGFLAPGRLNSRLVFIASAAALAALWWVGTGTSAGLHVLLWVACAFWCVALAWVFFNPARIGPSRVTISGLLALSFAWLVLARMRIDWQHGGHVVMYALLVVWLADRRCLFFRTRIRAPQARAAGFTRQDLGRAVGGACCLCPARAGHREA